MCSKGWKNVADESWTAIDMWVFCIKSAQHFQIILSTSEFDLLRG